MTRMHIVSLLLCLPILFGTAEAVTPTKITEMEVLFIYESRNKTEINMHDIAIQYSEEYRDATDEFAQQEISTRIYPEIDKKINEAAAQESVNLTTEIKISTYNFDTGSFQTNISASSIINFGYYALAFTNGADFSNLYIPVEQAKKIRTIADDNGYITITINADITSTSKENLMLGETKIVKAKIQKLEIFGNEGSIATWHASN